MSTRRKTQALREEDMVITRGECRQMIRAELAAYDRNATGRFGWWHTTLAPLRVVGAGLRHFIETMVGFGTYIGRRLRGQSHEEAIDNG